ncbi:hypothetical protein Salat_2143300 [Sesamum alatum]|uniref:Uncharacterized protein n=1 Tax=Sesamum alatum TaxID=300844 RepID=A0AAE2CH10_9LAMI|nr:hypothetical protein Salat_2143300 [Sesamum alatum]
MDDEISNLGRKLPLSADENNVVVMPMGAIEWGSRSRRLLFGWETEKSFQFEGFGERSMGFRKKSIGAKYGKSGGKPYDCGSRLACILRPHPWSPAWHISRFIEKQLQVEDFIDPGDHTPFGPWLRVAPPVNSRNRILASSNKPSMHALKRPNFIADTSLHQSANMANPRGIAVFGTFNRPPSQQDKGEDCCPQAMELPKPHQQITPISQIDHVNPSSHPTNAHPTQIHQTPSHSPHNTTTISHKNYPVTHILFTTTKNLCPNRLPVTPLLNLENISFQFNGECSSHTLNT